MKNLQRDMMVIALMVFILATRALQAAPPEPVPPVELASLSLPTREGKLRLEVIVDAPSRCSFGDFEAMLFDAIKHQGAAGHPHFRIA